jgi:crotonobetainyl-CoA:carnitine CoA-transferase CaiB-like acyl-CoA transferase
MAGACAGLKVVEIARGMPGALAGMVLADHGADVIRVEDPGGDPYLNQAGEGMWSRGKRRIALDLDLLDDREAALALAREADVVLCGVRPATAERWSLTYEALAAANPRVVFASISGFGWTGPYRDLPMTEAMAFALAGGMMQAGNGGHRTGPIFLAPPLLSYSAALAAVPGIIAALRERDVSERGQHVDTSLYSALLVHRSFALWQPERHAEDFPTLAAVGVSPDPRGGRPLFNLNECADGRWLSMAAWTPALAYRALELMGLGDLLADERFAGVPNFFTSPDDRNALLQILWDTFRTRPLQHWLDLMDEAAIPCEPAGTVAEFRRLGQLWANDMAVEVADPVVGPMVQVGVLGELSETPGEVRPAEASARAAGEAAALLQSWRAAPPAPVGKPTIPANPRGPLAGVRVLDFTNFLSGPMSTHLLADLGADVTKVEPHIGDDFRMSAPFVFRGLHREKRSVVLDLKMPGGEEMLAKLVRASDIVVYNYRLGVEDRLGLDHDHLKAINPDIIVCRITAFGSRGERAHRGGYDASITALSGVSQMQAGAGNPPVSLTAADISTGLAAATAMCLAMRARETQGVGQHVDVAMIGAMAYVAADEFADYPDKPDGPTADGGQHGFGPAYRLYQTADGWVFVAAAGSGREAALAQVLGQSAPLDAAAAERTFATRTTAGWLAALTTAGVPAADPNVAASTFLHQTEEFRTNGTRIEVPTERYGRLGQAGVHVRFSRTPVRTERQEPSLGEQTDEVLRELGVSDETLAQLRTAGTIPAPETVSAG